MEMKVEELLEQYVYKNYKTAMCVIVNYCMDSVQQDDELIENKILSMVNDEEINKMTSTSILYKQILKPFSMLNKEDRLTLLNEAINCLKNASHYSEKNVDSEINIIKYKTKFEYMMFNLPSGYKTFNHDKMDFYAKRNDIEFMSLVKKYKFYDEPRYEAGMEDDLLNKFSEEIKSIDFSITQSKDCDIIQNKELEKGKSGLTLIKNKKMISREFIGKEKFYKVSVIKIDGEGLENKIFLITIIQICNIENKDKYIELNDKSVSKCIKFNPDIKMEETIKNEIKDKDLGIIKFDLAEKEAIITEITKKLNFDVDEIKFSFKDSGYNSEEFLENINKFIEVLKEIYKKQDQILKSLYQYAKKIYIDWEIKLNIEDITDEYVIKNTKIFNIDIYDNGAYITAELCDEDDDSDDLLGGHGFSLYFDIGDNDFKWSLEG